MRFTSTIVGYFVIAMVLMLVGFFPRKTFAATSTISGAALAWSDKIGWINFNPTQGGVVVGDAGLTGYVWSQNYGWIHLNPAQAGVKNNGFGILSGSAWGEQVGWIDFSGVTILPNGSFAGTAHGSVVGSLSFTCSTCSVVTSWRPTDGVSTAGNPVIEPLTVNVSLKERAVDALHIAITPSSPGIRMRIGLSLSTLFSPWIPYQSVYTVPLSSDEVRKDAVIVYAQIEDDQGRISPITPFAFSLLSGDQVITQETSSSTPFVERTSFEKAYVSGAADALSISCVPFLTMDLPQSSASKKSIIEVRKLQYFLQSFLPRTKSFTLKRGVYDTSTRTAVKDFERVFASSLNRAPRGVVDIRVRSKINEIACQAQLQSIFIDRAF